MRVTEEDGGEVRDLLAEAEADCARLRAAIAVALDAAARRARLEHQQALARLRTEIARLTHE